MTSVCLERVGQARAANFRVQFRVTSGVETQAPSLVEIAIGQCGRIGRSVGSVKAQERLRHLGIAGCADGVGDASCGPAIAGIAGADRARETLPDRSLCSRLALGMTERIARRVSVLMTDMLRTSQIVFAPPPLIVEQNAPGISEEAVDTVVIDRDLAGGLGLYRPCERQQDRGEPGPGPPYDDGAGSCLLP